MLEVEEFESYQDWYEKLRDKAAKSKILARIFQVQAREELVGDYKQLGDGVAELRIHSGPGYRIYVSIRDKKLLLLLVGGTKRRQQNDIDKAKKLLKGWVISHEGKDEPVEVRG